MRLCNNLRKPFLNFKRGRDMPMNLKKLYPESTHWGILGSVGIAKDRWRCGCGCTDRLVVWKDRQVLFKGCAQCTKAADKNRAANRPTPHQLSLF